MSRLAPTSLAKEDRPATWAAALQLATGLIGRLEARLLLQAVCEVSAATLIAHPERALTAELWQQYSQLLARRQAGEPIAYLLGRREFHGHDFLVAPGVLIPRPETELLVDLGVAAIADRPTARVLDLGCGSGCVALSLALAAPQAEVWAVDASAVALALSRRNAERLGVGLTLRHSDWFAALSGERFDLLLSNPPYIAAADPHLQQGDLRFEPLTALASGADGLDAIRQLVSEAPAHLHAGGWLYLEHGYDQAVAVAQLLAARGFVSLDQQRDLAGIVRVSGGRWPS